MRPGALEGTSPACSPQDTAGSPSFVQYTPHTITCHPTRPPGVHAHQFQQTVSQTLFSPLLDLIGLIWGPLTCFSGVSK